MCRLRHKLMNYGVIIMAYEMDVAQYAQRLETALSASQFSDLAKVAEILLEARRNNKWIFIAGNGGSASSASHFSNDLVKGLSTPSLPERKRFRALALCNAISIMTALANDYDYSCIFEEQLKNFSSAGDVLLLISGSGNSENIIKAAKYGRKAGLFVISFTGRDGGRVKELSDICCIASTNVMEEIEDVHSVWGHSLITALRSSIAGE
jgi:D-sedoheptulose 7-phosphate isomerase